MLVDVTIEHALEDSHSLCLDLSLLCCVITPRLKRIDKGT